MPAEGLPCAKGRTRTQDWIQDWISGSEGWGERAPSARGPARALPTAQAGLGVSAVRPGDDAPPGTTSRARGGACVREPECPSSAPTSTSSRPTPSLPCESAQPAPSRAAPATPDSEDVTGPERARGWPRVTQRAGVELEGSVRVLLGEPQGGPGPQRPRGGVDGGEREREPVSRWAAGRGKSVRPRRSQAGAEQLPRALRSRGRRQNQVSPQAPPLPHEGVSAPRVSAGTSATLQLWESTHGGGQGPGAGGQEAAW